MNKLTYHLVNGEPKKDDFFDSLSCITVFAFLYQNARFQMKIFLAHKT